MTEKQVIAALNKLKTEGSLRSKALHLSDEFKKVGIVVSHKTLENILSGRGKSMRGSTRFLLEEGLRRIQ